MVNLQQLIRQLTEYANNESDELVKKGLMGAAWILEVCDTTIDYQKDKSQTETCLGYHLENVEDDKDTDLLKKLGFAPLKKTSVPNKKVLFLCDDGTKILLARNQYKEQYPNDGPIIGKDAEEINLVNESDYIVVARYEMGSDKNAPYVDGVAFDIRKIKLVVKDGIVDFMPLEPIPNNATIYHPQSTTDWVKLENLPKIE